MGHGGLTLTVCSVTDLRRMDLLVVQLKAAIRRLLDAKGVRARVLDKVNRYGEVVIGIILEKQPPSTDCPVANRDAEAGTGRNATHRRRDSR